MTALFRNNGGNSTTGSSVAVTVAYPTANSYLLIAVGFTSATASVASITAASGTFAKIAGMTAGSQALEIWVGYNFGSTEPVSITVNQSASGPSMAVEVITIDIDANCATAPSATAATAASGTSTAPATNTLTPAAGDLLVAAALWANTGGSSARTSTGNTYTYDFEQSGSTNRVALVYCQAGSAVASSEAWTITSAAWCAIQAKWTPPALPSPNTALIIKGLDTAAADAASSY